jgi:phosphoribosylformimino-5-aminoimidazole carboxamide ribonucleotide (ProFAR) isomerase
MSYNGSGTFVINTAGQPVVSGTVISSTAFNALTADLGTGLSTAITKDGQTTTTARIPFAQGINSSLVTDATNTTTGSIITAGGVGVAKALYVGTLSNFAGAATFSSTINKVTVTAPAAVVPALIPVATPAKFTVVALVFNKLNVV